MSRQITLALLKADVASMPHKLNQVNKTLLANEFKILHRKRFTPSESTNQIVHKFYAEHEGKFFHQRLVESMKSGPFEALVLCKTGDAITDWRSLIGSTKVYNKNMVEEDTQIDDIDLRSLHGVSDTRNGFHGADSPESVQNEIGKLGLNFQKIQNELEENSSFIYVPELGQHLPAVGASELGFCKNVSKTLGLYSTWDRVYKNNKAPNEWFFTSKLEASIFNLIENHMQTDGQAPNVFLDIGCGTSNFCNILNAKYPTSKILGIDFSDYVIENRKIALSEETENIQFICHDLTSDVANLVQQMDINLQQTLLDQNICVIDKATIDAIVRQKNGVELARNTFTELLKIRPKYLVNISDEGPEVRLEFLDDMLRNRPEISDYSIIFENVSEDGQHHNEYFTYLVTLKY